MQVVQYCRLASTSRLKLALKSIGFNIVKRILHFVPPKLFMDKWHKILTPRLKFKWGNVWDRKCSWKEGAFIL
jgi:hypothetical protein